MVAILEMKDPKRLAWKIWASFLIPAVRCETFLNQEYTVPPAPKCLTRSRFLQLQPKLLILAYAWALQYWAEKVNSPTLDNYHPLVMSVVELRWQVGEHVTFSKWDVLCGLEDAVPEARSQNTEATTANIEDVEPQPMTTQGQITQSQLNLPPCLLRLTCLQLQKFFPKRR